MNGERDSRGPPGAGPGIHVDPDIRRAETLPGWLYHSDDALKYQRERIFARGWHLVADLNRVKAPGHVLPADVLPGCLDEPVVVTRDKAGAVHCLSNVCTHRGVIVVEGEGHVNSLRCRYHGRRFGLDGSFQFMPEFDDAEGFPSPGDNLPKLQTGQWGPFLFACLDPDPICPFDEWIGPVRERCDWMPHGAARFDAAEARNYLIGANWAPLAKNRTRVSFLPFVWDASLRSAGVGGDLHKVEMEDEEVVESQHRGLGSRLYRRGRFSPRREVGTHHFQRLLAKAMAEGD